MKIFKKTFLYIVLLALVAGCKLDPPIYPDVTAATTTTTGGTATYSLNGGSAVIKSNITFVITPASAPNTASSITISNNNDFSITTNPSGTGAIAATFLIGTATGSGTVTFTANTSTDNTHGTFKGSFTGNISTGSTTTPVSGTFSVTQ